MNQVISDIRRSQIPLNKQGIAVSYFQVIGEQDTLQCFHSHSKSYLKGQSYTFYEIPSLARLLAQKNGIISPSIRKSLSENDHHEICFIIEWTPLIKRAITFQFSTTAFYAQQTLKNIFKDKDSLLTNYFKQLHQR